MRVIVRVIVRVRARARVRVRVRAFPNHFVQWATSTPS